MTKPAAWQNELVRKQRGRGYEPTLSNIVTILGHAPEWQDVLAWDEFANDIVTLKVPPSHPFDAPARAKPGEWSDADTLGVVCWLTRYWHLTAGTGLAAEGVMVTARKRWVHPVRDWLNSLVWDVKPRLDSWMVRLGGCDDDAYHRAVGAMWPISCVARVFRPGCQVDHVPIFEGNQGIGKSTMLRTLAMRDEWFLETAADLATKDAEQILCRKWLVELSELDSLSRSEISRVKGYISERIATYRPSYGHRAIDFPRQNAFAGSTNQESYLKDDTGARRFWPIKLRRMNLEALRNEREQIWAEATSRYKAGEAWHITDPTLRATAAVVAEARRQQHPWERPVAAWIAKRRLQDAHDGVSTYDVLVKALDIEPARHTRGDEIQVGSILRLLGWDTRVRKRVAGVLTWVFLPNPAALKELKERDRNSSERKGTRFAVKTSTRSHDPNDPT